MFDYLKKKKPIPVRLASGSFLAIIIAMSVLADDTTQLMPEIVVSASRTPLPSMEIGSAVTVITADELEKRQVRIVSDVLRDVPGIAVNRTGPVGSQTQIRIRGAEANQTLVLIDGIEVNNPASGSEFNFANILNAGIARIEVLRGPQSAIYGSDAIGGVVNIITKDPEPGFTLSTRGEFGSFSTKDGQVDMGYGSDKFTISGTVERYITHGISVADEKNGNTEKDGYDNTTGRLKISVKPIENLEIKAVGMIVDSDLDSDASAAVVNTIDGEDSSQSLQRYGLTSAKLTLADGAWDQQVKMSYMDDKTNYLNGAGATTYTSEGKRITYGYQSDYYFSTPGFANADHTATFAVERDEEEQYTNSGFSGPNTVNIVNYGYSTEYRVSLWENLFLSGALRYDDNDDLFDNQITYRGTAAYLFDETATRFHSSFGRAVKNPTLFELFGSTPGFTGNPNLKPEEGFGWDAGVEQAFLEDKLILDVTYFNNRIENLIQGSGNTAVNLASTSRIQGMEFTASTEPFENIRFDASYTYTNGKDAIGTALVRRPKHIASLIGNYSFDVMERPANLNLSLQYNGKQSDIVYDSYFPVATRTVDLDSYTLVNLAASYEFAEGAEVYMRGENLLNEDYQEVYGYGSPGISFFAGLHIKFGPF
ncbi:TonB-dependent receptor plug domain-containing protein [Sneathiella sp. HT1-7]|uniref:TonB-dependent receptor plug domain-containing protein n=1 Tax=Sneathiella sp. HT1-7 TaxID=2887192 RepID=UPI001D14C9FE|nr:TonB-dependent receptor [Sneathiella sp. HT1-7]MCC3306183.1 TonB-dependent receptor [Sneathiella sp. HT1-7]